ncbi:MAG: OsmC family protein [Bdellovibrionales bacterium]|nr:OsmC family protein [Bdellovibrionales bacterium]
MKASLHFKDGFEFETEIRDHKLTVDTQVAQGGKNRGPSPKEILLAAIAGCSAMDMAALMRKYKIVSDRFDAHIESETTATHPKVFKEVQLVFDISVPSVTEEQIQRLKESAHLSLTKLCGVSAMVNEVSPIVYSLKVNGEVRDQGRAQFQVQKGT